MSKSNKRNLSVILAVVLAVLVGIAAAAWYFNRPKAVEGAKALTILVFHGDESEKDFTLHTDSENLRGACEEAGLIAGTESEYGLYVLTVDGETADESQQQWWCISEDGEMLPTGVDDTMIENGDQYEFTLKTGW